eukprot:3541307-Pleurochrysis_carterae.AAC.2
MGSDRSDSVLSVGAKTTVNKLTQQAAVVSAHAVDTTRFVVTLIEVARSTPGSNVTRSAPKVMAAVMSTTFTISETRGQPSSARAGCGPIASRVGGEARSVARAAASAESAVLSQALGVHGAAEATAGWLTPADRSTSVSIVALSSLHSAVVPIFGTLDAARGASAWPQ